MNYSERFGRRKEISISENNNWALIIYIDKALNSGEPIFFNLRSSAQSADEETSVNIRR
jgi:hypothetical protein